MNILYRYKEPFGLRHQIGTCPNIEVEVDVVDKTPFFFRLYHVKEEEKQILDKSVYKRQFLASSSPVMLISRKLTKDKRCVSNFRHM